MRFQRFRGLVLAMALSAAALHGVNAQTPPSYPFVIPWDDSTGGVPTNVGYLNRGSAGDGGFIVARDGHFFESKSSRRIRFLGTNFTFAADFPPHADAERVAAHLRKLGINIVRIHHHDIDNSPLWDRKYPDHQHLDAGAMDRLDYLIYQLKRNGIYVDLNLHVSREFTADDGFPPGVADIKTGYDKRVDYYDTRMIELQKKFAHDYLTHVNPYTRLAYAADPCVALIEINNENSLFSDAGARLAGDLADLPEPFRGELAGRWNSYLAGRYHTDSALQRAWSAGSGAPGPSLLTGASRWTIEAQGTSAAKLDSHSDATSDNSAAPPAHIAVSTIDDTSWHVQAHITGLNLTEGKTYTVTFEARADAPRAMGVYAGLDEPDWRHVGLETTARVTPAWKRFQYSFTARDVAANHCRLSFTLGNQVGTVELRNVSLTPGIPPPTASGDTATPATLAARNFDLPLTAAAPEREDWLRFLATTERGYADAMCAYLKRELGVHAAILCSQIMWGDSAGLYREAGMDFADGHAYWEHPSFPGRPWDPVDWKIEDRPMSADLATGGGTLLGLAEYRVEAKPYTVTEYNEPAPNDYQCETVPELAAFAALQDWDAIFLFDWGNYGGDAANDRIQSFFSNGSNPAKAAFLPAAALIFRGAELPPLVDTATLTLPEKDILSGTPVGRLWTAQEPAGATTAHLLETRLRVTESARQAQPSLQTVAVPGSSGASTFTVDHRTFLATSADAGAAAGFLGGAGPTTIGPATVTINAFGNNFCAVTVTPIASSRSIHADNILITLIGRVENKDMVWNSAHTSVGDKWGSAPTRAEYVPATITIPAPFGAKVWALAPTGAPLHAIPSTRTADGRQISFHTTSEAASLWYAVIAP